MNEIIYSGGKLEMNSAYGQYSISPGWRGPVYVQFWRCSFCNEMYESPTETVAAEIRVMDTGAVVQACKSCLKHIPNAAAVTGLADASS